MLRKSSKRLTNAFDMGDICILNRLLAFVKPYNVGLLLAPAADENICQRSKIVVSCGSIIIQF